MRTKIPVLGAFIACLLFFLISGCGPTRDYAKLDPRCKAWLDADKQRQTFSAFDSAQASMDDQYEYYICTVVPFEHSFISKKYFIDNWNEFLTFIPKKLATSRSDNETMHITFILMDIAKYHKDEIKNDTLLLKSWRTAIDNMDRKSKWAYLVSDGFYNSITRQP